MTTSNNIVLKQDYWSYVKRQFKKNKRALFSLYIVGFMAFIALFADFIANEKPIVCKYEGKVFYPILNEYLVNLKLAKRLGRHPLQRVRCRFLQTFGHQRDRVHAFLTQIAAQGLHQGVRHHAMNGMSILNSL